MFEGFERNEQWRHFIEKYSDRLTYGTDISGAAWEERLECLRSCFETGALYVNKDGYRCKGLNLSDDTLKKIYRDTYRTFVQPNMPKKIQKDILQDEYLNILNKWIDFYYSNDTKQNMLLKRQAIEMLKK